MRFLGFILLLLSNLSFAQESIRNVISNEMREMELFCLRTERNPGLILTRKGIYSNGVSFQQLKSNGKEYTITASKVKNHVEVNIYKENLLLQKYSAHHKFRFNSSNEHFFKLDSLSARIRFLLISQDLNFLKKIACTFTPKIYTFEYDSAVPLVFGIHLESYYFAPDNQNSFDLFLDEFRFSPRLITRDTGRTNDSKRYGEDDFLLNEINRNSKVLISDNIKNNFKLSPGGSIFFKFAEGSGNKIHVLGGFLNMCIANSLADIAFALIDSNKNEIHIILDGKNTYIQSPGSSKELTLPLPEGGHQLSSLKQNQKTIYSRLQQGLKNFIESKTEGKVEVVFDNQAPQTKRPLFRILVSKN